MHNLHYITVSAKTGKEACNLALEHIKDWGNENNWRKAGGAVSEKGKIYKVPKKDILGLPARWDCSEGIKGVEKMLRKEVKSKKINIFEEEYNSFNYDSFGITRLTDEGSKLSMWVVAIDMHS